MRRHYWIFALIPVVLVAAVGLGYYGYSRTAAERSLILDTMRELGREKVLGLESEIAKAERGIFERVDLMRLFEVPGLVEQIPFDFESVFILDDQQTLIPSGTFTRRSEGDSERFRQLFVSTIVPELELGDLRVGQRAHHHGVYRGRPMLFAFTRLFSGTRRYYIVVEVDMSYLVASVFPQYFDVPSNLLYQVVDQEGQVIYGHPIRGIPQEAIVEVGFPNTLSRWRLRVARRDSDQLAATRAREIIDGVLIGAALAVIVAGVVVLLAAFRRERRLSQLKSEFVSNVSHELKTPLSIISMFGEMLATGRVKSSEQAVEYAQIIRRESGRLSRLIDNVLDFAKIERGIDFYEFRPGCLGEVVERALELCHHRVERAGMKFDVNIEEELPELSIDENALTLAFLNLIDNAIKYADAGEYLGVTVRRVTGGVELSVSDHGPGIEEDDQAHIFERFYRARGAQDTRTRGSGIGLSIVKHVTDAHRGRLTVESKVNQGSTFRLWIPSQ